MRDILAAHEPILARVLSDTLIAAWLIGAEEVGRRVSRQDAKDAKEEENLDPLAPFATLRETSSDEESLVRFPVAERAAENLMARRLMTREDFDALAQDARRSAFTVAGIASLDALARVQQTLVEDVQTGGTLAEFRAKLDEALGASALAPRHLETVYRTNVGAACTAGLIDTLDHPLVADEFPYLQYHAVHDSRCRPDHLEMEKRGIQGTNVYRRDDPLWEVYLPPWDYNCRCAVIPLSVEQAAGLGIREAQDWLLSGIPPARPAWVKAPPFAPSASFRGPGTGRIEAIV